MLGAVKITLTNIVGKHYFDLVLPHVEEGVSYNFI